MGSRRITRVAYKELKCCQTCHALTFLICDPIPKPKETDELSEDQKEELNEEQKRARDLEDKTVLILLDVIAPEGECDRIRISVLPYDAGAELRTPKRKHTLEQVTGQIPVAVDGIKT